MIVTLNAWDEPFYFYFQKKRKFIIERDVIDVVSCKTREMIFNLFQLKLIFDFTECVI